ncbi:MAG: hypothetical protein WC494_03460 [Candidatus Pacearchaeota archaeon]
MKKRTDANNKNVRFTHKDISTEGRWGDYLGWRKNEEGNIYIYESSGYAYRICEVNPKSGRLIGVAVAVNDADLVIRQLEEAYYWRGERIR